MATPDREPTRLTKRRVDAAEYQGGDSGWDFLPDAEVPGFGVRIYESRTKSYLVRYRNQKGRQRLMTLGRHGVLTVQQAREMAREALVKVAQGEDPVQERREARHSGTTLSEFADVYLEDHAKPNRKTWKRDEGRLEKYVKPALGSLDLEDVTRRHVSRLHREIGREKPVEANRVLALVRLMLNKATDWGFLPPGHPNPAADLDTYKEESRERYLRPEEVQRLLGEVPEVGNPYIRAIIRLALLTGARKSELLSLRWEDVDLERREINLPEPKQGRPHTIPLSEPAVEILSALPRESDNPYVFPGRKEGSHLTSIRKAWRKLRERADLEDMTFHDLRRTVGSWLAQDGVNLQVVGEVLGHTSQEATRIYARLSSREPREALERHAELVQEAENGEDD